MTPGADVARIVDAHHHLWDLGARRYPWLQGPREDPGDPSGLGPLQRNYLLDDYLADAAGLPLVASVHVQAAHDPADPVGETRWLQETADRRGFPQAIVAEARLESPELDAVLEGHLEHANVRGIRQMLNWHETQPVAAHPGLMADPAWRAGLARLEPLGLSFDLQVFPHQLAEAAAVCGDAPDTVFVLNHGGFLLPGDHATRAAWRDGLRALADRPNVVAKASAYAAIDPRFDRSGLEQYVDTLVDAFGVDRVMFASNFPLDRRVMGFTELVTAYLDATASWSPEERDAFFFANAVRTYRIGDQ